MGSTNEAENAVREAWLRLNRGDAPIDARGAAGGQDGRATVTG